MSREPLKVCMIQDYLPPYRIPLFKGIADADGVDFTLLMTAQRHTSYAQWTNLWRDLPFSCEFVPGWRFHIRSESESGFNPALIRKLIRIRPDVIICGGFSLHTIFALLYKLFFRAKIVVWTEATATTESYLSYPSVRTCVRRIMARFVDAFVDAGTEAREYAQNLLAEDRSAAFFRSYNAIDNEDFSTKCATFRADTTSFAAFRDRFAPKNILFSGQLIDRKNVLLLLRVYQEVCQNLPEPVGLIMLGQGPRDHDLAELKDRHQLTHLYLEGFQPPEHYYKYFAVADVFALLSVYDCNPLVIFEALAAGLPTICSNRAGNAIDFIENGENGFVVDPGDFDGIVSSLQALLDAHDRPAMSDAARSSVQKANYRDSAEAFVEAAFSVGGR